MTRKDIEDAYYDKWHTSTVDFILEMVRQHNEECAKIADLNDSHEGEFIAKTIREAKP